MSRLPTFYWEGREWSMDTKLGEFRSVSFNKRGEPSMATIQFASAEGERMLQAYRTQSPSSFAYKGGKSGFELLQSQYPCQVKGTTAEADLLFTTYVQNNRKWRQVEASREESMYHMVNPLIRPYFGYGTLADYLTHEICTEPEHASLKQYVQKNGGFIDGNLMEIWIEQESRETGVPLVY